MCKIQFVGAPRVVVLTLLLGACGGQGGVDEDGKILNDPIFCLANFAPVTRVLSADEYPGSAWLSALGWENAAHMAAAPIAYADELGTQKQLGTNISLSRELVQLGLFNLADSYRISLEIKSADAVAPVDVSLALHNPRRNQNWFLALAEIRATGADWQTLEGVFTYESLSPLMLEISSLSGSFVYRNLQVVNLSPNADTQYSFASALAGYVSQGWSVYGAEEIGAWLEEIVGDSMSRVEWDVQEDVPAECVDNAVPSTDYLLPPLAAGHRYLLTATPKSASEAAQADIKLIAYGSMQTKTPDVDFASSPVFLKKVIDANDSATAAMTFVVDSTQMSSLNLKLVSAGQAVRWKSFQLSIMD